MKYKEVLTHPVPHIRVENVFTEEQLLELQSAISGEIVQRKTKAYDLWYPAIPTSVLIVDAYKEVYKNRYDIAETLGATLPEGRHQERGTTQGFRGPDRYNLHLDTPQKMITSVVYLSPEQNTGTLFYENGKGEGEYEDPWKVNCGYIFCRSENSWHTYENKQDNIRWVAMYNIFNRENN